MSEYQPSRTINRLKPGDHMCCLYETDEEYQSILIPLLQPGLEQGEKVICIFEPGKVVMIRDYLQNNGCDVESYLACGQLRILPYTELFGKEDMFDPDKMIERVRMETEQALKMGYSALRVIVDMTWVLRDYPGTERLIAYEARLNHIFPSSQCLVICHYDRRCFEARILRDILHTHPLVVIGAEIYENFYYIPPNELLDEDIGAAQLRYWLKNLVMRRNMEEALQNIYLNLEWEVKERTNALAEANEILRDNEAQLKEAQQLAQVGSWIWIVDTDTFIWSEELYRIAGRDSKGPAPRYAEQHMLYTPESWARLDNAVKNTLENGESYQLELQIIRPDGTLRWIFTKGTAVRDNDKRIIRLHGIIQDITESKQAEASLRDIQKLEAIGALAGGIAHDFNNLLSGIFGYINLAYKYATDNRLTKIEKYMSKALDVFERAKALTYQLLTFAKGGEPVKKTFFLPELLKNTTAFALTGSNVNAVFNIAPDLWPCDVDENQISQVIDNIVINARQAMPEGGTVEVSAKNISAEMPVPPPLNRGRYVFISFRDQGIGIAREYLSRIFEPFFTTKQQGSGLGLATSYSIISKHGGHITVESELHKGANFLIYLPASNDPVIDEQYPVTEIYQGQGRILVMDDEEYIRDLTSQMLENMGYTVECAADGNEAVKLFAAANSTAHPFDAVILDLTIPGGMGGRETIQKLITITPSVKAIASSGYSEDPVMARPHEFGFVAKLKKPYLDDQLGNVLGMVMNRDKVGPAL